VALPGAAAGRGGERGQQSGEKGAASHRPEDTGCVPLRIAGTV
jgi:hypothetical protein